MTRFLFRQLPEPIVFKFLRQHYNLKGLMRWVLQKNTAWISMRFVWWHRQGRLASNLVRNPNLVTLIS